MRAIAPLNVEILKPDGDLSRAPGGRRQPLDRGERIRRQLAQVYWSWRDGAMPSEEMTKAAFTLKTLHSMLEGKESDRRLTEIEAQLADLRSRIIK